VRLDPESEVSISSYANDMDDLDGLTLEDLKKQSEKMYEDYSTVGENEFVIKKNKNNHEYLSMFATNQK
jgi:hypothetical protein